MPLLEVIQTKQISASIRLSDTTLHRSISTRHSFVLAPTM